MYITDRIVIILTGNYVGNREMFRGFIWSSNYIYNFIRMRF